MNFSKYMENKIKIFVSYAEGYKSININIQYGKHLQEEFFQIDNNNLNNIINKIDKFKLDIMDYVRTLAVQRQGPAGSD